MINSQWLDYACLELISMVPKMFEPLRFDIRMSRINFHGPKDVWAIEVWLYVTEVTYSQTSMAQTEVTYSQTSMAQTSLGPKMFEPLRFDCM